MPELPECERARRELEKVAKGNTISKVTVYPDVIVFGDVSASSVTTRLEGKVVQDVRRKGKNFYLVLSSPPHPIFHFGMSGTAHIRGLTSATYRVPRGKTEFNDTWPPKYVKMIIEFTQEDGKPGGEWGFCDARRLGRIKLVDGDAPEESEPLCSLGADTLLDMPSVEVLEAAFGKRNAPIKAVLLDQNGPLCGLGNWMVDEVLYQVRIHPAQTSSSLTNEQTTTLHRQIENITATAVSVNAEASEFPPHWIFSQRWNKGKKGDNTIILPSGEKAAITFVTVAGRTSAIVEAVQILPEANALALAKKKAARSASGSAPTTPTKRKPALGSDDLENPSTSPYFTDKTTSPFFPSSPDPRLTSESKTRKSRRKN